MKKMNSAARDYMCDQIRNSLMAIKWLLEIGGDAGAQAIKRQIRKIENALEESAEFVEEE